MKKISIAMCTYNGEKYLKDQLDSLVKQTIKPDEIVISDDNSSDATRDILFEYKKKYANIDFNININHDNLGVYKNFEKAISLCTGDIIFCCDQDDIWLDKKIEKTIKMFKEDTLLVFSNAYVTSFEIENNKSILWNKQQISARIKEPLKTLVFQGGSIAGCCLAFKKELLKKIVPFPDEIYHDDWIATTAAVLGRIECIDEPLMFYRQHGNNAFGIKRGNKLSYIKSLIFNPKPYIEHRTYIYNRNKKMFKALIDKKFIKNAEDLHDCLIFNKNRANIEKQTFKQTRINCFNDKKNMYYQKYGNGNNDFIYDLYLGLIKNGN